MGSRLDIYCLTGAGMLSAKNITYSGLITQKISAIYLVAGLYKPSFHLINHSLIVASLSGKPPVITYQVHGKRQRRTSAACVFLLGSYICPFLDKFVHEVLPIVTDFRSPKWQKGLPSKSYTLRIRHKFNSLDDFDDLVDPIMHDSHKGIFLPLTIHFIYNKLFSHAFNENFFRMLRVPICLFRRRFRPAFDDHVTFA